MKKYFTLPAKFLPCCISLLLLPCNPASADFFQDLAEGIRKSQQRRTPVIAPVPARVRPGHPAMPYQQMHRKVTYEGYSKAYLPIKKLQASGQLEQAYKLQKKRVKQGDAEFLNSVEAGILAINANKMSAAIKNFAAAEHYLKLLSDRTVVEGSATTFGSEALSFITGIGDFTEYGGEPYERILMLNYKSIAYLLNGERKAYNVTRRAIDWQNIEKKEFDRNIKDVKKETRKQEAKVEKKTQVGNNIFTTISNQYKASRSKAMTVSSAYVNPFGFYMAGIVQEFDSYEDASLRDNARISYGKALKLNPSSKVIKKAVKATKKSPPRKKRLIQIVAADGFAPEKKTLTFNFNMNGPVPIKIPIFEPVKSTVAHIKVKSGKTTLATLSTVADIEAIILRHQLDSLPYEHAKVYFAITRNIMENEFYNRMGGIGGFLKSYRESIAIPDMRAWMSLPKTLSAARFYASKKLKSVKVISYDKKWRVLAKKTVQLKKKAHNFIYVRSIEKNLYTNVAKKLWVKAK
jgi:hypothetical protein